jgi:hypothetical protein
LLLALVEQSRLRGHVGAARLALNRPQGRRSVIDRGVERAITEMQRQKALGPRLLGMDQGLAGTAGDSRETAAERPLRVDQFGDLPQSAKLLGEARDPLVDEFPAKAAGDKIHIGPRVTGPRCERTRQAFGKLVDALDYGREQRLRLRPPANRQIQALTAALRAPREALLRAVRELTQLSEQL